MGHHGMKRFALMILLIALAASLTGCATSAPTPRMTGVKLAPVTGLSMYPAMKEGEVWALYCDFPYSRLKLNDIVAYKRRDNLLCGHRITHKATPFGGWVLRGDNNDHHDTDILTRRNYVGLLLPF